MTTGLQSRVYANAQYLQEAIDLSRARYGLHGSEVSAQTTTNSVHIDFDRDIRPILSDKCFVCHGPDAANNKSKLRFDTEAHAFADLGNGRRAIVHGDPKQSQLVRRISAENAALRMPPVYSGLKLSRAGN